MQDICCFVCGCAPCACSPAIGYESAATPDEEAVFWDCVHPVISQDDHGRELCDWCGAYLGPE